MKAIGRLGWIQIDANDPMLLARFWGEVLGAEIAADWDACPRKRRLSLPPMQRRPSP